MVMSNKYDEIYENLHAKCAVTGVCKHRVEREKIFRETDLICKSNVYRVIREHLTVGLLTGDTKIMETAVLTLCYTFFELGEHNGSANQIEQMLKESENA
jgi:hypothetical protein